MPSGCQRPALKTPKQWVRDGILSTGPCPRGGYVMLFELPRNKHPELCVMGNLGIQELISSCPETLVGDSRESLSVLSCHALRQPSSGGRNEVSLSCRRGGSRQFVRTGDGTKGSGGQVSFKPGSNAEWPHGLSLELRHGPHDSPIPTESLARGLRREGDKKDHEHGKHRSK